METHSSEKSDSLWTRLWQLFSVFFKIGACTFGGGIAMLPVLDRELTEKRGWTDSDELLDYFAIGQSTPGIIAVNVATFIGHKRAGIIGGIVGTLGMVAPSIIIISIIATFISNFSEIVWVQKALTGINVSVAALLTYAVSNFAKKSVKNLFSVVLFLVSFLLIFVFKVNTIFIIFGSCFLGVIIGAFAGSYKKTEGPAASAGTSSPVTEAPASAEKSSPVTDAHASTDDPASTEKSSPVTEAPASAEKAAPVTEAPASADGSASTEESHD